MGTNGHRHFTKGPYGARSDWHQLQAVDPAPTRIDAKFLDQHRHNRTGTELLGSAPDHHGPFRL